MTDLPEIGYPDSEGNIRLNDTPLGHSFARSGRVLIEIGALSECLKHGWVEMGENNGLIAVERPT